MAPDDLGPVPEPKPRVIILPAPQPKLQEEAKERKKRGRPAKPPVVVSDQTVCRIRMRLTVRKGEKMYAILVNTKARSPEAVRGAFKKWAAQIDKVWTKL